MSTAEAATKRGAQGARASDHSRSLQITRSLGHRQPSGHPGVVAAVEIYDLGKVISQHAGGSGGAAPRLAALGLCACV